MKTYNPCINGLKFYKPYSNGLRTKTVIDFSILSKKKSQKSLLKFNQRSKGRNNQGAITIRHKGGGHKRMYRKIDFKRHKYNIEGKILSIEYDPNRNANIALVNYLDGEKRYILHPKNLKINDVILSGIQSPLMLGNSLPLIKIPVGTYVHNVEFIPKKGGQVARSAGSSAKILAQIKKGLILRLSSKEVRLFSKRCFATIGEVGNATFHNQILGKAGRNRWLGNRPAVRGSAMNAIDHPHGGGEGKCPIGKPRPLTPWGKPTLGLKTRSKKSASNKLILKRCN